MRVLQLQHGRGVEHVLRGGAEVHILAKLGLAHRLQRAQRRHQRVFDAPDLRADRLEVHVLHPGLCRDLLRRRARDDAQFRLLERQRRLVVVPLLHAVAVAENRAQLLRAPDVLEQRVVENAGCHFFLKSVTGDL